MFVFDFEVFMYDWLVVFKDITTKEYTKIINNVTELETFYKKNKDKIFFGYNSKNFDNIIFDAVLSGIEPYSVMLLLFKDVPIYNIYKTFRITRHKLNTFDLMQDILGMSLKEAEGYMGMSVEETTVPFDLDRKLNDLELRDVLKYCTHDVDATEQLLNVRQDYIKSKMNLCKLFNLPMSCLDKTNAGLASIILNAKRKEFDDEFEYTLPPEIQINSLNYKKILDLYIGHKLDYRNKLKIDIAGVPHILAYGGIHGAIDNFVYNDELWLIDAASFYPTMMIKYGFVSRSLDDIKKYEEIYYERLAAKKAGDIAKADALKLTLNTAYGAMKSKFNNMYDPKMANAICITGQLLLVDLIEKIEPYCKLVQSNTDGIMVIPLNKEKIKEEISKWEERTHIIAEVEVCTGVWQKDVNNYIITFENGKIKAIGGYVTNIKANRVNPLKHLGSARVVDLAVVNYFVKGISVEETINNHNELVDFQIITKTGPSYDSTYWRHKNGEIKVNKVNRVFATKHEGYGNLFKTKTENGVIIRKDSIASLPAHCYVDNEATMKIEYIDRQYYIDLANKRISDFKEK